MELLIFYVAYVLFGTQENHRDIRIIIVNLVIIDWVMNKEFIIGDLFYILPIGYSWL